MAGLEGVRAQPLASDGPPVKMGRPVPLVRQERAYALSRTTMARIEVARTDVELAWVEPPAAWSIESDSRVPPWTGYVDEWEEDDGAASVSLTLVDPVAGVLGDTRSGLEVTLQRSTGLAVRQLLEEREAWSPTGLGLGRVDDGPFSEETLRASSLQQGLEALTATAPGYDWWLEGRDRAGSVETLLNWGQAGRDRRAEVLEGGVEILKARQRWKRSGLVRSVAVVGVGSSFAERPAVEFVAAGEQAREDIAAFTPAGVSVEPKGVAGRRELVVMDRSTGGGIVPRLEQRAETVLRRVLELSHTVELELDLTNERVQNLALGDRFAVSIPRLMLGAGLVGVVRLLGYEPHEEDGRLDAIVSVEELAR